MIVHPRTSDQNVLVSCSCWDPPPCMSHRGTMYVVGPGFGIDASSCELVLYLLTESSTIVFTSQGTQRKCRSPSNGPRRPGCGAVRGLKHSMCFLTWLKYSCSCRRCGATGCCCLGVLRWATDGCSGGLLMVAPVEHYGSAKWWHLLFSLMFGVLSFFKEGVSVGMRKLTPRSILIILDQPGSPDRFVSGCWLWTVVWLVLFCFVHVCFVVSVFAFFFVMVAGVI